jgi:hypothetical protein
VERSFDWHQHDLEHMRAMSDHGCLLAIAAAAWYCTRYQLEPLPWLFRSSTGLLCSLLAGNEPKSRGRAQNTVSRYRQELIHHVRWLVVEDVLDEDQLERPQLYGPRNRRLAERIRSTHMTGMTKGRAYELASEWLQGSDAQGGALAIKRSYRKVERAKRNPSISPMYRMLDPSFLRFVGAHVSGFDG